MNKWIILLCFFVICIYADGVKGVHIQAQGKSQFKVVAIKKAWRSAMEQYIAKNYPDKFSQQKVKVVSFLAMNFQDYVIGEFTEPEIIKPFSEETIVINAHIKKRLLVDAKYMLYPFSKLQGVSVAVILENISEKLGSEDVVKSIEQVFVDENMVLTSQQKASLLVSLDVKSFAVVDPAARKKIAFASIKARLMLYGCNCGVLTAKSGIKAKSVVVESEEKDARKKAIMNVAKLTIKQITAKMQQLDIQRFEGNDKVEVIMNKRKKSSWSLVFKRALRQHARTNLQSDIYNKNSKKIRAFIHKKWRSFAIKNSWRYGKEEGNYISVNVAIKGQKFLFYLQHMIDEL